MFPETKNKQNPPQTQITKSTQSENPSQNDKLDCALCEILYNSIIKDCSNEHMQRQSFSIPQNILGTAIYETVLYKNN